MYPCTATRKDFSFIDGEFGINQNQSNQLLSSFALTTANTGSNLFHPSPLIALGLGLVVLENAFRLNINFGTGQIGGQFGVLALFSDG
ncbi:MAG: hypothetical protein RL389_32 [Actinomycetota bacterium]